MRVTLIALIALGMALSEAAPQPGPPEIKNGYIRTSDGVRLHYLEAGSGPSIVFVPGWLCPAWIWEPQVRRFSAQYRVVAMDPRSQGESEQVTEGLYPERRARDIKELIEQLGLAPAVVVGHSMGVIELLTYVDQFGTATLAGLALIDAGFGSPPLAGQIEFLHQLSSNRGQILEQMSRGSFKNPQPPEFSKRIMESLNKVPTSTAIAIVVGTLGRDFRPMLHKLDKPILYAITPALKGQGEVLKAGVPAARVELFENSGHVLFVDEPERFNKLLGEFAESAFAKKAANSHP